MVDFKDKSIEELVEIRDGATSALKVAREAAKATAKADAEVRDAYARKNVVAGSAVSFMFANGIVEGKALRVSEKTVTVEFELNGETVSRYRKYSDITEVSNDAVEEVAE